MGEVRERDFQPGEVIPGTPYHYVGALGRGGFGVVYLVEHGFTGRRLAFKALHASMSVRADLSNRMKLEARLLGQMRHPNIVEVTDGGITEEDPPRPFITMELLRGYTLRYAMRSLGPRYGVRPALSTLAFVLDALDYAHMRFCAIHRDIKPDNIFLHVPHEGAPTTPKLLDFGIAKLMQEGNDTGSLLGTPRYMAPEQIRPTCPLSPRTDLYAVGIVAYQLLTGSHPFASARSENELCRAHLEERPASTGLPSYIDEPVMACLEKDPDRRPRSAAWLASVFREVSSHVAEQTVAARAAPEITEETAFENLMRTFASTNRGKGAAQATPPDASGKKEASPPEIHGGTTDSATTPPMTPPSPALPTSRPAGEPVDRRAPTRTLKPPPAIRPRNGTLELSPPPSNATPDRLWVPSMFDELEDVQARANKEARLESLAQSGRFPEGVGLRSSSTPGALVAPKGQDHKVAGVPFGGGGSSLLLRFALAGAALWVLGIPAIAMVLPGASKERSPAFASSASDGLASPAAEPSGSRTSPTALDITTSLPSSAASSAPESAFSATRVPSSAFSTQPRASHPQRQAPALPARRPDLGGFKESME